MSEQTEQERQAAADAAALAAKEAAAAEAKAGEEALAKAAKAPPKHLALDYTGPLTGDQAQQRIKEHGELPYRKPVTKPASVDATKSATKTK